MNTSQCNCACPTPQLVQVPGLDGVSGTNGTNGKNAFSIVASPGFAVPNIGGSITVQVDDDEWMAIGAYVVADGPATFTVNSKPNSQQVTLVFVGATGDVAPGTPVLDGSTIGPAGAPGTGGGGSGSQFFHGNGSPEGAVVGSPGDTYNDDLTNGFWQKLTGVSSNTGWFNRIA